MIDPSYLRVMNIAMQGTTLASRFMLIFFLARFLEPAQLGVYGLLTVTIGYSLFLLGFDFYTYTTRELIKHERTEWGGLLKDQGVLSLVLYAFFMPLLSLIFVQGFLPWHLAGWFFLLLILEHLNQELGRLLVAISEPLVASAVLFLRQGSWAIAITAFMAADPDTRSLEYVLGAWTAGGIAACITGIYRLAGLGIAGWRKKVSWHWISAGLKVAIPFFVATLALRGIYTLDRYWLQALGGLEVVGAYVLFGGIAGALMTFLDAGVFAFSYPGLIKSHNEKQPALFRRQLLNLFLLTCLLCAGFAVISLLLVGPLLSWMEKPLYLAHQDLYPWLLAATVLYAMGMVPHYALYAQGFDRHIIYSHIASLCVFVMATFSFADAWPLLAVPIGLCSAVGTIAIWKTWAFFVLTPASRYRAVAGGAEKLVRTNN